MSELNKFFQKVAALKLPGLAPVGGQLMGAAVGELPRHPQLQPEFRVPGPGVRRPLFENPPKMPPKAPFRRP